MSGRRMQAFIATRYDIWVCERKICSARCARGPRKRLFAMKIPLRPRNRCQIRQNPYLSRENNKNRTSTKSPTLPMFRHSSVSRAHVQVSRHLSRDISWIPRFSGIYRDLSSIWPRQKSRHLSKSISRQVHQGQLPGRAAIGALTVENGQGNVACMVPRLLHFDANPTYICDSVTPSVYGAIVL